MNRLQSLLIICLLAGSWNAHAQSADELIEQVNAAGKAERFDEAIARCTAALATKLPQSDAALLYLLRADAYVHKGEFDRATTDIDEALKRNLSWPRLIICAATSWMRNTISMRQLNRIQKQSNWILP